MQHQMTLVVDGRESGVTMEEGGAGRRRQFVTLWKKAAQGGGCSGWSSDAMALFPSPPRKSPSLSLPSTNGSRSRTKDHLTRLIAMDMQAGAASSSISLSPRLILLSRTSFRDNLRILSYCYTRWVQCSRRAKSQEEEVALCEHASFHIPTELRVCCWVLI